MRLPENPKSSLAAHLTTAAVALESLPPRAALRAAATPLLTLVRETLAQFPEKLPPPLTYHERKMMSRDGKKLIAVGQALAKAWCEKTGKRVPPTWMRRSRREAEATHFKQFFERLPTVEYVVRHAWQREHSLDELQKTYVTWRMMSDRAAERQKLLPLFQTASAYVRLLAGLIAVVNASRERQ